MAEDNEPSIEEYESFVKRHARDSSHKVIIHPPTEAMKSRYAEALIELPHSHRFGAAGYATIIEALSQGKLIRVNSPEEFLAAMKTAPKGAMFVISEYDSKAEAKEPSDAGYMNGRYPQRGQEGSTPSSVAETGATPANSVGLSSGKEEAANGSSSGIGNVIGSRENSDTSERFGASPCESANASSSQANLANGKVGQEASLEIQPSQNLPAQPQSEAGKGDDVACNAESSPTSIDYPEDEWDGIEFIGTEKVSDLQFKETIKGAIFLLQCARCNAVSEDDANKVIDALNKLLPHYITSEDVEAKSATEYVEAAKAVLSEAEKVSSHFFAVCGVLQRNSILRQSLKDTEIASRLAEMAVSESKKEEWTEAKIDELKLSEFPKEVNAAFNEFSNGSGSIWEFFKAILPIYNSKPLSISEAKYLFHAISISVGEGCSDEADGIRLKSKLRQIIGDLVYREY